MGEGIIMEQLTYIALQTGGYYYDACLRAGFCNPGESCVIEYKQFMKYVNESEVSRPVFVSLDYGKCLDVARQLQDSIYSARAAVHGGILNG
jgi:hypothetical protein